MTTEDDFHRHLDEHPDDHHARLVFADFLQERGDPRAEGYRALGINSIRPHGNRPLPWSEERWSLWNDARDWSPIIHPGHKHPETHLPADWYAAVGADHNAAGRPDYPIREHTIYWTSHYKRRVLEDAVALAFSKLPHERKQELLGQQAEKLSRRTYSRRTGRRY